MVTKPFARKRVAGSVFTLFFVGVMRLHAQELLEMGPSQIREMFPLFSVSLSYQASDPTPIGHGRFQFELDHMRANTFEFSDVFKSGASPDSGERVVVTREFVEANAQKFAQIPLLFFFDAETVRTTLRLRYGLSDQVDLWAHLPFQNTGPGYLDGLIETFHKIGFEQYGRSRVAKHRMAMVIVEHGHVSFYRDEAMGERFQDLVLGLTWVLKAWPKVRLAASVSVKLPLTTTFGVYRTGWDQSYALTGRWAAGSRHIVYFGGGYVRRPRGSEAYNSFPFGTMRDGAGIHLGWEHRGTSSLRPFFHLLWQSPYLHYQPHQKLDRPSLQHDLGLHWQFQRGIVLSFHYQNNITHNENTADMGLGLTLTGRF